MLLFRASTINICAIRQDDPFVWLGQRFFRLPTWEPRPAYKPDRLPRCYVYVNRRASGPIDHEVDLVSARRYMEESRLTAPHITDVVSIDQHVVGAE